MAKKEQVKYNNKKGCWKRSFPSILLVLFVLIFGVIIFCEQMLSGWKGLEPYRVLVKELETKYTDEEISKNLITEQDETNFMQDMNLAIQNKDGNSIFESGAFVYENVKPENLNYVTSELVLDGAKLGCFINYALRAGWVDEMFEDGQSLLKILEVRLNTQNERTKIFVIGKVQMSKLFESLTPEEQEILQDIKLLIDDIYFTYVSEFNYLSENKNITSSMQINKLTEKSNNLLLKILFGDDSDASVLAKNLNSILEWTLHEFDVMLQTWGLGARLEADSLVLVKN